MPLLVLRASSSSSSSLSSSLEGSIPEEGEGGEGEKDNVEVDTIVDEEFKTEMMEVWKKRQAILQNPTTQSLPLSLTTSLMETIDYPDVGSFVVNVGEKSSGFYFVKSGKFECIQFYDSALRDGTIIEDEIDLTPDDTTMKVLKVCSEGDVFGEIGVFLNEPRALSVRSITPNSSVWYISKENYNLILKSQQDNTKKKDKKKLEDDTSSSGNNKKGKDQILKEEYTAFIERRERKMALRKCPLFKSKKRIDDSSIERIASKLQLREVVTPGEIIVKQGSENDDEMYFVVAGQFECYDEESDPDNNIVVSTIDVGGYFGELALFLDLPRKLSVRAAAASATTTTTTTPTALVYVLSRQDLVDSVDSESIFNDEYFDMLQAQYRDAGMVDRLFELQQYLSLRSRPEKKPVSIHSTISVFAAGSFLQAYTPFVEPGFDQDGFVQFFNYYGNDISLETCHQIQFSCFLLAISAIGGFFRIPPNAPNARKLPFTLATLSSILFSLSISSSLNALPDTGYWQYDAFTPIGTVVLTIPVAATSLYLFWCLDEAISGSGKGTETVPGAIGRIPNILLAAMICWIVNTSFIPFVLPIYTSDLVTYQQEFARGLEACNLSALDLHGFATGLGFVSFLQLVSTLQFEKKISKEMGFVSLATLFYVFNIDALVARYKSEFRPELLPLQTETNYYIQNLLEQHHIIPILMATMGLVVLNGFRKVIMNPEDSISMLLTQNNNPSSSSSKNATTAVSP